MKQIRIGNGCGFWGDQVDAPASLAAHGQLDYLTLEYLAELTMSILALLRERDPNAGYATDFLDVLRSLVPQLQQQPGLKIVTNAGGMNPMACALAAKQVLHDRGVKDRVLGVVSGDDLLPRLDELLANGHELKHLDTGEPLASVRQRAVSANAYLGSAPIATALGQGATIVITGRVADASLTVGPCLHEFGWADNAWDLLGAATVAGHLIECGAQATGGLWVLGSTGTGYETIGYPFVDMSADGALSVGKPAGTGGVVNLETITEQLLYEVADPAKYYTPDVVADFTTPRFVQAGPDRVSCTGATGHPATDSYKVSVAYRDGFTATGTLVIVGPHAVQKARHSGAIIFDKLRQAGHEFEHTSIEVIGAGDTVPTALRSSTQEPPEVMLRVGVRDPNKAKVARFTRELAPLVTSGYPGTTGYTTGRATVREVFGYWPTLVAKSAVRPQVELVR